MSNKGDKCCCCAGGCVNTGSIFNQCTVCAESPIEWYISDWGGAISRLPGEDAGRIFGCCLQVDTTPGAGGIATGMVSRLLTGNRLGSECAWRSTINFCEDEEGNPLPNNYWKMTVSSLAPGGVTLKLLWDDYKSATWVNRFQWNCLCRNEMRRNSYLDEGDSDEIAACGIPDMICVSPIAPCCPERRVALPRTLYADLTVTSGTCACLDGVTLPLAWDPYDGDGKWVYSGLIGSCSCDMRVRLYCQRILGSTLTNWFYDTRYNVPNIQNPTYAISGVCEPLQLSHNTPDFAGCCGAGISAVNVTFHE